LSIPSFLSDTFQVRAPEDSRQHPGAGAGRPGALGLQAVPSREFQKALGDLLEYIEAGFTDEKLRALAKRVERAARTS